jgi:hypothetical protein
MGDLFERISFELEQALVPVRFGLGHRQLVVAALLRLGVRPDAQQSYDWPRQIEDVREKMLARRRFGCFYLGAPHCLAAKQWWFIPSLVNSPWEDEIVMTPRVVVRLVPFGCIRVNHSCLLQCMFFLCSPNIRRAQIACLMTTKLIMPLEYQFRYRPGCRCICSGSKHMNEEGPPDCLQSGGHFRRLRQVASSIWP